MQNRASFFLFQQPFVCIECGKGFARSDYLSKHAKLHSSASAMASSSSTTMPAELKSVVDSDIVGASPSMADLVRTDDTDLLLSDAILPGPDHLDPF